MRTLTLLYLMPLCVMLTSCTKPIYTSFETSKAKMKVLSRFSFGQCSKIEQEPYKNAEQILSNKDLIDYKKQYYENGKIQINQYEITDNKKSIIIKNKADNTIIHTAYNHSKDGVFNISYDKQHLGICDRGKLRIFDLNNNLYELEHYKDKKCTEVYFSLDDKYLIVNNKNQGQVYDFKAGNLVYNNPNNSLSVSLGYDWSYKVFYPMLIMGYATAGNEIILLDEEKRIIVEGLEDSSSYRESIKQVRKNKEGIDVLVWELQKSWVPFVSFAPTCSIRILQEF
ncbi:hypothetical protein LS66_000685 [Helicobacter sp. MIT 03-1614]|uniref:hypothetical protein n=1 Tax=Helicobacter sp. MIT 03-1614 TaxID=1548147 RepID=UPI00051330C2|nr:hypothetical protein [Helicobacter sp. MIT 03-1614]TLD90885.1 hypothetical protein LS66_000685 [Helicobacter sp. MIT 03-1614]